MDIGKQAANRGAGIFVAVLVLVALAAIGATALSIHDNLDRPAPRLANLHAPGE